MADETLKYEQRGVSASKSEVHQAISGLDKGLYPHAFCKILPDFAAGSPEHCNLLHADTAGTKTSLAYLYWRETGDLSVWAGIVQDAIVMNLDDMACVGCTDDIILSNTIGRNKNLITGEVLQTLIGATADFVERMSQWGVRLHLAGGETADVGDIVRTADVGFTAFARMRRDAVIEADIRPGQVIVGLASFGQARYESAYNSGIGSNGLTAARHDLLAPIYAQRYPESFDPHLTADLAYTGKRLLSDPVRIDLGESSVVIPAGKLLLSPTRTFLPVLRPMLQTLRHAIGALIHCTGGGQAKAMKFLRQPVRLVKDNLFETPPVFVLIQENGGASWREMYQVFNMGHRMELYLDPAAADEAIAVAREWGVEAQVVGRVEAAPEASLRIESPHGIFDF